jgi:Domain of unknown function (DUF4824)
MRLRLLLGAAALVAVVNAVVLAGVAWNRGGEPDAVLTLTERELPTRRDSDGGENSGVSLGIVRHDWLPDLRGHDADALDPWLSGQKLAALGFELGPLPRDLAEAHRYAHRQLERRGFLVLQQGGSAWEAWQARVAEGLARAEREVRAGTRSARELSDMRSDADHERWTGSRLFAVDAGPDPASLRQAHPDRQAFLILPARFRVHVDGGVPGMGCLPSGCRLLGTATLLIDEVSVPRRLQAALPAARPWRGAHDVHGASEGPRYEVVLRAGRRREPWVEAIRPVPRP